MIRISLKSTTCSIKYGVWLCCNFAVLTALMFIFTSCGQEGANEMAEEQMEESNIELNSNNEETVIGETNKEGKVFYSIPSPIELTMIIKKAGAKYDKNVLNSTQKISNYVTQPSMALNLGVYGADLSYSSIFEQTQETMHYFAAAKKLADDLSITSAFGASTVTRIQNNLNNRDSLVAIISDSYWETDAYLKENRRSSTSGLVITGGWIEGLYISTKLAETSQNKNEIISRIGEQKLTLNNLIAMLHSFKDEEVGEVLTDLKELQEIYTGVTIKYTRKPSTTDSKTQITTLNTTSQILISEEQFKSISNKIQSIRTKIVK